jgi:hypothetical protein
MSKIQCWENFKPWEKKWRILTSRFHPDQSRSLEHFSNWEAWSRWVRFGKQLRPGCRLVSHLSTLPGPTRLWTGRTPPLGVPSKRGELFSFFKSLHLTSKARINHGLWTQRWQNLRAIYEKISFSMNRIIELASFVQEISICIYCSKKERFELNSYLTTAPLSASFWLKSKVDCPDDKGEVVQDHHKIGIWGKIDHVHIRSSRN